MKHTTKWIAILLAVVMTLGCLPGVSAAQPNDPLM